MGLRFSLIALLCSCITLGLAVLLWVVGRWLPMGGASGGGSFENKRNVRVRNTCTSVSLESGIILTVIQLPILPKLFSW